MKRLNRPKKIVALLMLLFAVGFNLRLYRLEPTSTVDPNDNAFQFALVDRTNQIWDFANKNCSGFILSRVTCHVSLLIDHWVPNWTEGYNLPYYYSHIPQIAIVLSYKLISLFASRLSLFTYYHWVIYLLMCLFPLPVFLALRIVGLSSLTAGIGALLATHISTDGLYGLDPPSFLWRGWGLSSQLFSMIFMPLAIAYSYRYFSSVSPHGGGKSLIAELKDQLLSVFPSVARTIRDVRSGKPERGISAFWLAVLFLFLTTAGHLGLGMIAMMSLAVFALAQPLTLFLDQQPLTEVRDALVTGITRLVLLGAATIFFLSYWIVPVVLGDNYHNISFWDPVWKFNSYGWKEIMKNFLNGNLFDFGRPAIFTVLVLGGALACIWPRKSESGSMNNELGSMNHESGMKDMKSQKQQSILPHSAFLFPYFSFSLLFVFWFLLYFGRTTWGGILDVVPGMKEFHISRFIVGVHLAGLFLAPIGFVWFAQILTPLVGRLLRVVTDKPSVTTTFFLSFLLVLFAIPPIYRQTVSYNNLNDTLILQAKKNYAAVLQDSEKLFSAIRSLPPGRVFAGRGGWWGKDFRVAETPYYMHLSTYGIPTVLWLPETWSPNSDTEQYFSEDAVRDYDLYNIRYVATHPGQQPQPFWNLIRQSDTWKLYEVATSGYFTVGVRAAVVGTNKRSYGNIVRLWIQSPYSEKKLFPELRFIKNSPADKSLPYIQMLDEATYTTRDGKRRSLFAEPPIYAATKPAATLMGPEDVVSDMVFKTTVKVDKGCRECILILKQTYHPNWRATVDGKRVDPINVFPFFTAVPLTSEGTHEIVMWYQPGTLKVILVVLELAVLIYLIVFFFRFKRQATR